MENYLVMKDITKVYDNGVIANDKVNFSARKGKFMLSVERMVLARLL